MQGENILGNSKIELWLFCQLLAVILPIKASPSNGYNLCGKKSEPQTNLAFGLSRCRMQDEGPLAFS